MMCSTNPIAQLASSFHDFPPSNFFSHDEKDDLYSPPPATEKFPTSKQDSVVGVKGLELEQCDEQKHVLASEVSPRKIKKTSKKDNRSKIHTAQGPRHRRVRLSIEVARKFFFLQDLLGFDKPSKTLDWMFKMSKIPIDELVQGMKQSSSSSVTDEQDKKQKKKRAAPSCLEGKGKKKMRKQKSQSQVNQSRAEARARARARERTKQKLHIKKLEDPFKFSKVVDDRCCHEIPSYLKPQSSFWRRVQQQNEFADTIGEALMGEKMLMSSSTLYSYQHNLPVSKRSNIPDFPKFTLLHDQCKN